ASLRPASRPRFWRELTVVVVFYVAYELIADVTAGSRYAALSNALAEVHLERAMGLFHEQAIQHFFLGDLWLVQASNDFYATVHFVMPVVALVWLWWKFPGRYRRWRNALAWLTGISLVVFVAFPVLPPRLLPATYRFVDTMQALGGAGRLDGVLLSDVGNAYAAMPSLHVAWAAWCAAALVCSVRRWWLKVLLVADPIATTFVVVVTANHLFLDVIGGALVLVAGIGLSRVPWPRLGPRSRRWG
ncbi:MAG: phosphatase PAP2 family protein, partial [Acidimicrobiales bacterium]